MAIEPEDNAGAPTEDSPQVEDVAEPGVTDDIRSARFATARRGYDRGQVDEFLSRLASRLEKQTGPIDSDIVRRRLQEVGESTTSILTAAEETARKLQSGAAAEAERLKRTANEAAQRLRSEAEEFAETTREKATEEARRLRMEASHKAEEIVASAEARAEDLLERSLERRRGLDANIERLLERREEISERLRDMADELRNLADSDQEDEVEEADESEQALDEAPTRRFRPAREVPDFGFDDDEEDSEQRAFSRGDD